MSVDPSSAPYRDAFVRGVNGLYYRVGGGGSGPGGVDEVHVGATAPTTPFDGQMWVDTTGAGSGVADAVDEVYVGATPPPAPFDGQMWVDLTGQGSAPDGALDQATADARYYRKTDGGGETVNLVYNVTATYNVILAQGNVHEIYLDGNTQIVLPIDLSDDSHQLTLLIHPNTRAYTWSSNVYWAGGTAPVGSTAAGKVDVISLLGMDNGSAWYGFPAGLGF